MLSSLAVLLAVGSCAPLPHDPGLSSVRIHRDGAAVVVHAAFANADFRDAVGIDADSDGRIDASELAAGQRTIENSVAPRFILQAPTGTAAPGVVVADVAENDDIELTMRFPGTPDAETLTVAFLESFSRGHRCYTAAVDASGAIVADALLTPAACIFALPARVAEAAGFGQGGHFVVLGIEHILLGFDHLAFLLALLLAGVTLRRAVATITAFTIAHSVTLVAAAIGILGLPSLLVEAAIAGSIVWVAAMNLLPGRAASQHRWPFAFAFGLVHGFGFAGVLADLHIGGSNMLVPMLAFNVGVEIGQLAFALAVVPLIWWAMRGRHGRRAQSLLSVGVGLAGVFWFCQRVLG